MAQKSIWNVIGDFDLKWCGPDNSGWFMGDWMRVCFRNGSTRNFNKIQLRFSGYSRNWDVLLHFRISLLSEAPFSSINRFAACPAGLCPQDWMIFRQYSARTSRVHWSIVFSPSLKKSIGFLKYALKMVLVKGEWFDLYRRPTEQLRSFFDSL